MIALSYRINRDTGTHYGEFGECLASCVANIGTQEGWREALAR